MNIFAYLKVLKCMTNLSAPLKDKQLLDKLFIMSVTNGKTCKKKPITHKEQTVWRKGNPSNSMYDKMFSILTKPEIKFKPTMKFHFFNLSDTNAINSLLEVSLNTENYMQAVRIPLHPGQTHITIQSHKSPSRTLLYRYLSMYKLYVVNSE